MILKVSAAEMAGWKGDYGALLLLCLVRQLKPRKDGWSELPAARLRELTGRGAAWQSRSLGKLRAAGLIEVEFRRPERGGGPRVTVRCVRLA